MIQRMQQFEHVAAHELPALYDDFALSERARTITDGYVVQLQDWIAGSLNYYRSCHRYGADDLARRTHRFLPEAKPSMPFPRHAGVAAACHVRREFRGAGGQRAGRVGGMRACVMWTEVVDESEWSLGPGRSSG